MSGFDLDDSEGESLDDQGEQRTEEEIRELATTAPPEGEKRERREKRDKGDKKPSRSQDGDIEAFLAKTLRGLRVGDDPRNVGAAVKAAGKDYQLETLIILVPGYFQRCEKAASENPDDATAQARAVQAARWQTLWTEELVESLPDALDDEDVQATSRRAAADREAAKARARKLRDDRIGTALALAAILVIVVFLGWLFNIAAGTRNDPSRAYTTDPIFRDQNPVVRPQSDPMRYRSVEPQATSRKSSSDVPFDPIMGK